MTEEKKKNTKTEDKTIIEDREYLIEPTKKMVFRDGNQTKKIEGSGYKVYDEAGLIEFTTKDGPVLIRSQDLIVIKKQEKPKN